MSASLDRLDAMVSGLTVADANKVRAFVLGWLAHAVDDDTLAAAITAALATVRPAGTDNRQRYRSANLQPTSEPLDGSNGE